MKISSKREQKQNLFCVLSNGRNLYKKLICIIAVLCLCQTFNLAHAQRYLPGQKGIQLTGGMADGFKKPGKPESAYYFGAALATYTKNGNRWVVGAEYFNKEYEYKNVTVPVSQFTGEGGYYIKILYDRRKTVFLSFGLSALAGYETSNWGNKLLYDGSRLLNKDTFIYGGASTLELETYLTDRVVFLINARERMLLGSSIGKFHTQFGVGFKFIIN